MTKDELSAGAQSVLRHLCTLGAGALAAHGLAGGDQLASIGGAVGVFGSTLAWSWIQKSKLLAALCEAAPLSEIEALAANLVKFRAQGANPLLVSNIASTVLALANQELLAAHPELAQQPTTQATEPAAPPSVVPAAEPSTEPASAPLPPLSPDTTAAQGPGPFQETSQ